MPNPAFHPKPSAHGRMKQLIATSQENTTTKSCLTRVKNASSSITRKISRTWSSETTFRNFPTTDTDENLFATYQG